jgi:uncharacterized membrane protein
LTAANATSTPTPAPRERQNSLVLSEEITIAAPIETVWSVYTDVAAWPQWTESVSSAELLSAGPLTLGSTARIKQPRLPRVTWTVTELEPGRSWVWSNDAPGAHTRAGHELTPTEDGGTVAQLWIDQRGPVGAAVGRLARGLTRRYLRMEAEGLKRRSEARVT